MKFTEGAMSISVKKLLKLNMIEQIPSEHDGRCNMLVVTDKGKMAVQECKDYMYRILGDVFKGFNIDELAKINELLMKINRNLDEILMDMGNLR